LQADAAVHVVTYIRTIQKGARDLFGAALNRVQCHAAEERKDFANGALRRDSESFAPTWSFYPFKHCWAHKRQRYLEAG
jgi:hypothetical protein